MITRPHVIPNQISDCSSFRTFWPCIDSNATISFRALKDSIDIDKIVRYISSSTIILWSYENTFCMQRKQFLLFCANLRRVRHESTMMGDEVWHGRELYFFCISILVAPNVGIFKSNKCKKNSIYFIYLYLCFFYFLFFLQWFSVGCQICSVFSLIESLIHCHLWMGISFQH